MRMLRWLVLVTGSSVFFAAVLFGAGRLGRGSPSTLVVARVDEINPMQDRYSLILVDIEHGIGRISRLFLPELMGIDWSFSPPQVIQRAISGEPALFTFATLDAARGKLDAVMTYTTVSSRAHRVKIARTRGRIAVYDTDTGEFTLMAPGQPQKIAGVIEAGIAPSLVWSPDGSRLAVKDIRAAPVALADNAGVHYVDVFRDSVPVWSPDSRYVLFTQDSFIQRNGRIRAYDAATGQNLPTVQDVTGRSAAWCGSGSIGYVRAGTDGRHTVRLLDAATGKSAEILGADALDGQEIDMLTFAPRAACDWLLVTMRTANQVDTRLYRLHAATGELTLLGENARILSLMADAVVFDSNTAGVALTVGRAAFEAGAGAEILGRAPSQGEAVTWYGDFRYGLFRRDGTLWRIDLAAGTSAPLPLSVKIDAFQILSP